MKNTKYKKSNNLSEEKIFINNAILDLSFKVLNHNYDEVILLTTNLLKNHELIIKDKLEVLVSRAISFNELDQIDQALIAQLEFITLFESVKHKEELPPSISRCFNSTCLRVTQIYLDRDNSEHAEKYLQKISKEFQKTAEYKSILSTLLGKQRKFKESLKILDDLLSQPEGYMSALNHYNKGACNFDMDNFVQASKSLEHALTLDPSFLDAKLMLIKTNIRQYKFDLALKRLSEISPNLRKESFFETQGSYYYHIKNYSLAELNYKIALRINPSHSVSQYNLVNLCFVQGKLNEFAVMYEELSSISANNISLKMLQLQYCYLSGQVFIGQKETYKKLLKDLQDLEPTNLALIRFEIETLLIEKEYGSVIDLATQALALNPRDPIILQNLGKAYLHKKEYDLAFKYLTQAYDIYNDLSDIKTDLGNYYFHKKDYNKAIEYYTKEQGAESNIRILNNLAASYYALKEYYHSIKYLQTALKLNPFDDKLYTHLGLSYLKTETYNKALDCFKIAITFNPSSKLSLNSYIEEAVSNIGIEQRDDLIKEMREMSLDKKRTIGKASKYEKAAFKLYRTQTELEKTKAKINEKTGWGDKYPKPGDAGVSTLSWKGYDVEKSRVYGWLDESNAEIAKLDEQVKIRIRGILKEGTFTDRVKNQQGVKYYDKHTVAIKNLGAMGAGDIRIIGRRIKNITGESLFVFDEVRTHGRG